MTKIKICGMMREEDIDFVNEFLPDYAGFIFARGRRRYITPEKALFFRQKMNAAVQSVGVFVNEDIEVIRTIASSGAINIIQLHGSENDEMIVRLKEETGLPVVRAFHIETEEDIEKAKASPADYILLDNGAGGTGEQFDWSLIKNIGRDYFIAGGLDPENAAEAVEKFSPFALDVSSGVETDGQKDREKIKIFITSVRNKGVITYGTE